MCHALLVGGNERVKAAELAILTSSTRRDPDQLRTLLHKDFAEIGRSGRLWDRNTIITSLGEETERPTPVTDEWAFAEISPGLVLVTYRIQRESGDSRHSSIWDVSNGDPVLRFHQGTLVQP